MFNHFTELIPNRTAFWEMQSKEPLTTAKLGLWNQLTHFVVA